MTNEVRQLSSVCWTCGRHVSHPCHHFPIEDDQYVRPWTPPGADRGGQEAPSTEAPFAPESYGGSTDEMAPVAAIEDSAPPPDPGSTEAPAEAPTRYWQTARTKSPSEVLWKDLEGKPIYLKPEYTFDLDLVFTVNGDGRGTRRTSTHRVLRYKSADRVLLEHNGFEWEEPSRVADRIASQFREQLIEELKEHMPWDGEL